MYLTAKEQFPAVWAGLIVVEPTLGYTHLHAKLPHTGGSCLRRHISSYDGLPKHTHYGGLCKFVF